MWGKEDAGARLVTDMIAMSLYTPIRVGHYCGVPDVELRCPKVGGSNPLLAGVLYRIVHNSGFQYKITYWLNDLNRPHWYICGFVNRGPNTVNASRICVYAKQCSVYREPVVDWAFIEAYRGRAPEFAGEIAYFVANTQPIDSISSGYFSFMILIWYMLKKISFFEIEGVMWSTSRHIALICD